MGKPKKETVRKLRGLMILDQMEGDCDCCKNKRNEKKRDFEGNESHEK